MRPLRFHRWNLPVEEAIRLQNRLRTRLICRGKIRHLRTVAGADLAYDRGGETAVGVVVVMDILTDRIVETVWSKGRVRFPYIPGLLSFREGPVLLACCKALRTKPQVILFDGQGIAHPRRFGIASHLGYLLDLPAVGCAKSLLYGFHEPVGKSAGSEQGLLDEEGRPLGKVLRSQTGAPPIYISPGHRIGIEGALRVVQKCLRGHRLPEPLFHADRLCRERLTR